MFQLWLSGGGCREEILLRFGGDGVGLWAMSFQVPRIRKWPFFAADGLFLALAGGIVASGGDLVLEGWELLMVVVCMGLGSAFGVWPFLAEYREEARRFEAREFGSVLGQVRRLEEVGKLVSESTEQWREMAEKGELLAKAAEETAVRVREERELFREIAEKADAKERDHLRLDAEKLRRSEREWLGSLAGIMYHVFALHRAGKNSGQAKLIQQLNGFQGACLDICRRVGLSQYVVREGETFDPKIHKAEEGRPMPKNPVVRETLAPGFSFQGRRAYLPLVALAEGTEEKAEKHEGKEGSVS